MDDELFDGIAALADTSGLQETSDGSSCSLNNQFTDIEEAVATSLLPKDEAQPPLKRYKDDCLVGDTCPLPAAAANGMVSLNEKSSWMTGGESCNGASGDPHLPSDGGGGVKDWLRPGIATTTNPSELPAFGSRTMDGGAMRAGGSSDGDTKAGGSGQAAKDIGKQKGAKDKRRKVSRDASGGGPGDETKKRKRKKNRVQNHLRKNIRDILTDDKLESETVAAQQAEMERKRRLQEIQQRAQQEMMAQQMLLKQQENHLAAAGLLRKDSYHHPMMGSALRCGGPPNHMSMITDRRLPSFADSNDDVILVESSSDSGSENDPRKMTNCVVISSSDDSTSSSSSSMDDDEDDSDMDDEDDDDDIAVLSSTSDCEDSKETEDVSNSGSHVNDEFNVPDAQDRVLVNVGHPADDPDIFLAPHLARIVKPHQVGGIRFMYDNVVESLNSYKTTSGFGCILAHSMGLGKTLQVVSFVDVFLRHTEANTVLIIVPINTIQNWVSEFEHWIPQPPDGWKATSSSSSSEGASGGTRKDEKPPPMLNGDAEEFSETGVRYRRFEVIALGDAHKTNPSRAKAIRHWSNNGGVLLMGYELYRIILSKNGGNPKLKRGGGRKGVGKFSKPDVADPEEDEKNKELILEMQQNLQKPDLVICDEGHRIKNCHANTSLALKNLKTRRRIVLTGYPLQNNLIEYWCMVDFVRPNFLGTRVEFCNMFERPIQNGQCVDSTPEDIRLMRYRAHVLHSLLEGFVQRRGHSVLRTCLPQKYEHVLLVRMTPVQRLLYRTFMQELQSRNAITNPIKAFSVCCKIWNHPDVLYQCLKNLQMKGLEDDLDLEEAKLGTSLGTANVSKSRKRGAQTKGSLGDSGHGSNRRPSVGMRIPQTGSGMGLGDNGSSLLEPDVGYMPYREKPESNALSYEWAHSCLKDYRPGVIDNGLKMVLAFRIIEQSLYCGDRLLLFSQSLFTLSLIEEFLGKLAVPFSNGVKWAKNKNYFRLDGSTSSLDREKLVNEFNSNSNILLFLISTRAGSLGINLVGANRVIVFDASWNPCHDTQAVCRIYRYGQTKPCYVYRMVTDNTLEKKIYDRQINKQGMSDRVVDELSPDVTLTMKEVSNLLCINEEDAPEKDLSEVAGEYEDAVLKFVCLHMGRCLARQPFEHESQLMDRKELKLTKTEKRMAKQSYEMDKKASVHFRYGGYSRSEPFQTVDVKGTVGGRPVANVRPMQSTAPRLTPLDILAKQGVTFRQIHLTKEVQIPLPDGQGEPIVIPPGQQVMIISSPKGIFLRCPNNKLVQISPPTDAAGRHNIRTSLTTPANRFQGDSIGNNSTGSHEAEVIDLSDDDDEEEDEDDDDDVIVTASSAPNPPGGPFAGSRSVIVSPGSNTYTSQNPGLLTGGMVLRNDSPLTPPVPTAQQQQRSSLQHRQQPGLLLPHPATSVRPSAAAYVHPLTLGPRTSLDGSSLAGQAQSTNYCGGGGGDSSVAALLAGASSNGDLRVTGSVDRQQSSHLTSSSLTSKPMSVPGAAAAGGGGGSAGAGIGGGGGGGAGTPVGGGPVSASQPNSELPTSAMDYLNKALSTPSYSQYPPWGSSGGGGWSGGSYVQGQSQAADNVAFVTNIRELLLHDPSRLFPASSCLPELVTAPLSSRHLGPLYPYVREVAQSVPAATPAASIHQQQQDPGSVGAGGGPTAAAASHRYGPN